MAAGAEPGGAGDPVTLALTRRLGELAELTDDEASGKRRRWEQFAGCEVILPSEQFPWGVVFFLGGALLGQYPRLCYDALLRPLADRSGCCVVAVPYETDTDHDALALQVQDSFEVALPLVGGRYGMDTSKMPIFGLGHSLGAKLHVIRHCKGGASESEPLAVMAFNNFGLTDSLALAREALQAMQGGVEQPGADMVWNFLEPLAKRATTAAGLEFTPGPEEMEEMIRKSYRAPSTQVVRFGVDRLDCGEGFIDAAADTGNLVQRVQLPGSHLTPIFLRVSDFAAQAMKGNIGERLGAAAEKQSLEVGDEEELEALIEKLVAWLRAR